jgi:hypothetical protein
VQSFGPGMAGLGYLDTPSVATGLEVRSLLAIAALGELIENEPASAAGCAQPLRLCDPAHTEPPLGLKLLCTSRIE